MIDGKHSEYANHDQTSILPPLTEDLSNQNIPTTQTIAITMAELKTQKNKASVAEFLNGVENEKRRKDSKAVLKMMKEITGEKPTMWGPSIVGFGDYEYKYPSGQQGKWFKVGFSPRKTALTLYIMTGFDRYEELMKKLGKYKTGKSCLYINKLEDVDSDVLRELIDESVKVKSMGEK